MFKQKPELSIVIPAYNCGQRIEPLVNIILSQNYQDFEIIIVNDQSTDHTADVLTKLAATDNRIKIITQAKNGGASVARNTGISKARGQYLMFFDADDTIRPDMISLMLDQAKTTPAELVVSGFTVKAMRGQQVVSETDACINPLPARKDQESWRIYVLRLLGLDGRLYQVWNKVYRADIIKKHKIKFEPGINFGEDLVFNLHYLAQMTGRIEFVNQPLYIYQQDLIGGTFSKSSLLYNNRQQNYAEVVKFVATEPDNTTKVSLLSWLQYSWLYSHLLAVQQSSLSQLEKSANIHHVARVFTFPPFSDPSVIGSKKVRLEKLLAQLVRYPDWALRFLAASNYVKYNKYTAGAWQFVKRSLNR